MYERDGARLHVATTGHGPDVVLIHGLSGSGQWWRHNVPALSREHRVHVLDLAGYGRARRQRALGVQAVARLVAAWLEERDLHDVTVIGHSMGGHISLHVTALVPDRVSRLVLAAASGLLRQPLPRVMLALPGALVTGRKRFLPQIIGDALRAGPRNLLISSRDLLRDSVQELLPAVHVPTLVIWGARDALVPVSVGRMLAGLVPGATLHVIPGAGHVVMVDAAPTFNRLVLDFMAEGRGEGG
ncbi:pimeloyl-ACP methyl ester carboxylesterase [Deinococcus metalli]|uniref:Dihydrolipoamide acetyltransferase n=1 Tax=Deinococcus metalli TaxID=1141878 RepID=A0A7W8KEZ8_9DEIO|nr:alpha/beta fold hydrolase [Deinococcus metalli]MBB5375284.1 pimeloyl-ACP methyl ester carboxylesterase [Deinococcus metalli]GHF30387.1 dihydrolipoamide acetyltransferase [Deinococcus metalli]